MSAARFKLTPAGMTLAALGSVPQVQFRVSFSKTLPTGGMRLVTGNKCPVISLPPQVNQVVQTTNPIAIQCLRSLSVPNRTKRNFSTLTEGKIFQEVTAETGSGDVTLDLDPIFEAVTL